MDKFWSLFGPVFFVQYWTWKNIASSVCTELRILKSEAAQGEEKHVSQGLA